MLRTRGYAPGPNVQTSESSPGTTPENPGAADARAAEEIQRLLERRRRRRMVGATAGVGAAAVVALVVLAWLLPTLSAPPAADGISYAQAKPIALGGLPSGFPAAPTVLFAVAVDARSPTVLSASSLGTNTTTNCTLTKLSGYPPSGTFVVRAFDGSLGSGLAPFWGFVFEATASGPYAVIAVNGTVAVPAAVLSGSGCLTSFGTFESFRPLPALVSDSPVAAAAAWGSTGSAYVAQNPNATTLTMAVFGGTTSAPFAPPAWGFVYGPCTPLSAGTVSTPAWIIAIGISSAAVLTAGSYTIGCPA